MSERSTTTAQPPAPRSTAGARSRVTTSSDLQALLADAVAGLAETTGASQVMAWVRRPGAGPTLLAAHYDGPAPAPPAARTFEAAATLTRATDLGEDGLPESLGTFAAATGLAATVPLRTGPGEPLAVLLLGGREDPPGQVRPRTLAALDSLARRLATPASAAMARERLGALDAQVRRLDRLAALGGLVAEIVHEIRNPLVSVKTFLQLLPDRAEDPEFRQNFLEVASDELRRIERLLDVVLEQARPQTNAPGSDTDLASVVDSVVHLVAHRATDQGVRITRDLPDDLPPVPVSGDALRQVVLNLTLNAIHATPEGGSLQIRARGNGPVEIRVEDEGPGVPPDLRERVFEPFFSTKPEAPGGLGLAISRRIVEEVGGTLRVEDRPGGGAVFLVRLPAPTRTSQQG